MSYLVLARKYRPQTFSEVVGQEHVTRTLANAFGQERVHHAFLFCGPRGVGKTTLARIVGKALNCVKGPTAEPCGVCEACTTIASGTAVDYHEMDGASNRGIDSIRELTEAVRYQPAALRKKVYVIDEVHMLTTEAFNALLKTLEEPPPHVTFVLATTEPHKVPVTILSRCQRYDFKLVPASRLGAHLRDIFGREGVEVEAGAVELLVRESGGSVRDALSLSDQVISYVGAESIREAQVAEVLGVADRALVRTLVDSLGAGDGAGALAAVDSAVARGLDEVQVVRALTRALHDVAVAQVDPQIAEGSEEERAELGRWAAEIEPLRVRMMCDRMMRACADLAESPEPRIVVDLALLDLAAMEPLPPIAELVERLAELERRLGGAGGAGGGGARKGGRPAARLAQAGGGRPLTTSASTPVPTATPEPSTPTSTSTSTVPPSPPPSPSLSPSSMASPVGAMAVPSAAIAAGSGSVPAGENGAGPIEPMKAWADVMAWLEEARELTLLGWYEHAVVLRWDEKGIELGFPAGAIIADLAMDPSNVAALGKLIDARSGRKIPLSVRLLGEADRGDTARSLLDEQAERLREETSRRQNEAREHPLTKMVLDTFGASIKEIKTDV